VRDLSLHILDLAENSIRAGASVVAVTVEGSVARDSLRIAVEDDGPGFAVPPEVAADPFYTTKGGKRTGLGLSLMQGAAVRAGGTLVLGRSASLGGALVEATMRLGHVDRSPLGDLGATISSMVATHPEMDVRFRWAFDGREFATSSRAVRAELPGDANGLATAMAIERQIAKCCTGPAF
jgi:hypothetical protein